MLTTPEVPMIQRPNPWVDMPVSQQVIISKDKKGDTKSFIVRYTGHIERNDNTIEVRNVWFVGDENAFLHLLAENHLLRRAVQNLWKNYLYNREYTGFLLGTYSKKEFCKIAETYAEPLDENVNEDMVRYAGGLFPEILGQSIDAADLSVILNVDHKQISDVCALTRGKTYEIEGK